MSTMTVFEKQGLKITFDLERSLDNPDLLVINMVALNCGLSQISDFLFQVAVPRVSNQKLLLKSKHFGKPIMLYISIFLDIPFGYVVAIRNLTCSIWTSDSSTQSNKR